MIALTPTVAEVLDQQRARIADLEAHVALLSADLDALRYRLDCALAALPPDEPPAP